MSEQQAVAAPAAVPTTEASAPVAAAPPVPTEPQGTPATPPALKRVQRLAQVREAVARHEAQPGVVAVSGDSPAAADAAPVSEPAQQAPKVEEGKAKAWADVMAREERARRERDAAKKERERLLQDKAAWEAEKKAQLEAAELLKSDPVAYAAKYGGPEFGKKLVSYSLDEKARTIDSQAAKLAELDQRIEQLSRAQQEREMQARVDEYLAEHRNHWASDQTAAVLRDWYSEAERDVVVRDIANRHAAATNEVLTPSQLTGTLFNELKQRLGRLRQSEAGRDFLKQFAEPAAAPPAKPRPSAEAPRTLSRDLSMQGTPPDEGRLRRISEKDRRSLIRDVLDRRQG